MSDETIIPNKLMCDEDVTLDSDVKFYDVRENPFRV